MDFVRDVNAALRHCYANNGCDDCPMKDLCLQHNELLDLAASAIEQLTAELEQIKRERDAAVRDLRRKYYGCDACKHYSGIKCALPVDMRKYGFTCWQWRGVCAEDGGAEDV